MTEREQALDLVIGMLAYGASRQVDDPDGGIPMPMVMGALLEQLATLTGNPDEVMQASLRVIASMGAGREAANN